ncbi:hypothetical protein T440DRAFT_57475 [Plenodomus tracheiphilus IPT5]|uniref:Uncharacterized protein n=1 Tax=Plenodomus tracheiphilus IPT5 TaxID=1408161 RepID=A0A6A7BAJ7_9PLEO|nr:hypothetical protein T440DRAFT_57475 [Plenodomus tracheiphilus IPT5]
MLFPALTLAFAGLAHAQSASESLSLSSLESRFSSITSSETTTVTSSEPPSLSSLESRFSSITSSETTTVTSSEPPSLAATLVPASPTSTLPLYVPYPISAAPESTAETSAASSSFDSARFWQHTYRDYYASIITVISQSTLVYAIDCAPNSAHPSYTELGFQSSAVCAAGVVGIGPITVTQGPDQWNFAFRQSQTTSISKRSRSNAATTQTALDIICEALTASTKTCKSAMSLASNTAAESARSSTTDDGPWKGEVSSLLQNFSTMTAVLVTITSGVDKLPSSLLSSLKSDALTITTTPASSSMSATPSGSLSAVVSASSSTAAAPRVTGVIGMDVMFGAAGVLGAAAFGF